MMGLIFAIAISLGLPLIALVYSFYKKKYIPFALGILAFTVSQVLIRIPIMQYLGKYNSGYMLFSATQPILFAIIIGLSAGVFEELARYVAMRYFMKQRDWQSGFLFGAGHGGIEAVLFVGINGLTLFFSSNFLEYNDIFFFGGIERFFAMMLHIGLSIIVLLGVVRKRFMYIVFAILIHGAANASIGILARYVPQDLALIVIEAKVAVFALAVFIYSLWIRRKGVLQ